MEQKSFPKRFFSFLFKTTEGKAHLFVWIITLIGSLNEELIIIFIFQTAITIMVILNYLFFFDKNIDSAKENQKAHLKQDKDRYERKKLFSKNFFSYIFMTAEGKIFLIAWCYFTLSSINLSIILIAVTQTIMIFIIWIRYKFFFDGKTDLDKHHEKIDITIEAYKKKRGFDYKPQNDHTDQDP